MGLTRRRGEHTTVLLALALVGLRVSGRCRTRGALLDYFFSAFKTGVTYAGVVAAIHVKSAAQEATTAAAAAAAGVPYADTPAHATGLLLYG